MIISNEIEHIVRTALEEAQDSKELPLVAEVEVVVERPQKPEHGDFATGLPLRLASQMKMNPMSIAEILVARVAVKGPVLRAWTAPPGFINVEINPGWLASQVDAIREAGDTFGTSDTGSGIRVQVEFVSVNPTGPVHVGHARGAVVGSTIGNVLAAAGYDVQREYYLNDAGSQIDAFNHSLLARYLQLFGEEAEVPQGGYKGQYMIDLAQKINDDQGNRFVAMDRDQAAGEIGEIGLRSMVVGIETDMRLLNVEYDVWFSERSLYERGQYEAVMQMLLKQNDLVDRDGATWFRSSGYGDDEDKVFVRSTGAPTYFATDVAYHYNKFLERKFDRVIDVLGADHQGHVRFMKALTSALGVDQDRLDLLIYQLVTLKRGDETVRASKRTGDFVTLRELVEEIGPDACRFFFLSKAPGSQMEFDLDLAKRESDENPVYYIQYAHARIAGVFREALERGIVYEDGDVSLLTHPAELELVRKMLQFPEVVELIADSLEPQALPHYSLDLAKAFHPFYQQCRVVSQNREELPITKARLLLVDAVRVVFARCLDLMGMAAPERM